MNFSDFVNSTIDFHTKIIRNPDLASENPDFLQKIHDFKLSQLCNQKSDDSKTWYLEKVLELIRSFLAISRASCMI